MRSMVRRSRWTCPQVREYCSDKRILLPVKHLHQWIEQHVLPLLKQAPFNKRDAQLLPDAGICVECPKRTGNNKLLFADLSENESQCTDPACYSAKLEMHVQKQLTAKPALVQISTAYNEQPEGSKIVTRNKYVEIRPEKAESPEQAKWPECIAHKLQPICFDEPVCLVLRRGRIF
ncbi:MAG: hypothetical protein ABI291_04840 [Acidobacteriaceae bacterium]